MMCMIYSGWCLEDLDKFISKYGIVMYIKIVRDRDGKETRRTQALISQATYKALCAAGFGDGETGPAPASASAPVQVPGPASEQEPDSSKHGTKKQGLRITPYVIYAHDLPGKGKTSSLFVPIPRELSFTPALVESGVTDKLIQMVECGIIREGAWRINVMFRSRETGEVSGCYITFQGDIDPKTITMIRILINDTFWPVDPEDEQAVARRPIFRCFWARAKVPHQRRFGTNAPKYNRSVRMTEQNVQGLIGSLNPDLVPIPIPSTRPLETPPVQTKSLGPQPTRL
jgi:hypothetical protein